MGGQEEGARQRRARAVCCRLAAEAGNPQPPEPKLRCFRGFSASVQSQKMGWTHTKHAPVTTTASAAAKGCQGGDLVVEGTGAGPGRDEPQSSKGTSSADVVKERAASRWTEGRGVATSEPRPSWPAAGKVDACGR